MTRLRVYGGWFVLAFLLLTAASTSFKNGLAVGTCTPFSGGDLCVSRNSAPTTGVTYYGNTGTKYYYFDGTKFIVQGGAITAASNHATCSLIASGTAPCTGPNGSCCTVTVPSGTACWCGNPSNPGGGNCSVSTTTAKCYIPGAVNDTITIGWL